MIKKNTFHFFSTQTKLSSPFLKAIILLAIILSQSNVFAQNTNKIAQGFNFLIDADKKAQSNIRTNATSSQKIT